ncbi:MAG: hypothetical protein RR550_03690 [Rikenellaceae bacterium]
MKYWKKGFYDEPQEGAVEITEEYYSELLNKQSDGYSIEENSENYPVFVNVVDPIVAPTYDELVEKYIREKYSVSEEFALLRQRNEKPDEFQLYYVYAEECKERARSEMA